MSFFTNLLLYYENGVTFANSAVGSNGKIFITNIRVVQKEEYVYLDFKYTLNVPNPIEIFIENKVVIIDNVILSCIDNPYTVPESTEDEKIIGSLDLALI